MAIAWPASLATPTEVSFSHRFVQTRNRFMYGDREVTQRYTMLVVLATWSTLRYVDAQRIGALVAAGQGAKTAIEVPMWFATAQLGNAGGAFNGGAATVPEETISISGGSGAFGAGDWVQMNGQCYQIHTGGSSSIKLVGGIRKNQGGSSIMKYIGDSAGTTLLTCEMVMAGADTPQLKVRPAPNIGGYFAPFSIEFESAI